MSFWHTTSKSFTNHSTGPSPPQNRTPQPNQAGSWASVPSDILCYICDRAFSETDAHYGVEMLALVCRAWYHMITAYGRPWSTIRIERDLYYSTVYPTTRSYVNTRLRHSHHYPLDITIRPARSGSPAILPKDMKDAINAVIGEGVHTRRWRNLDATINPYVRSRLTHPTPLLHRVELDGIDTYEYDLGALFPMAPNLRVLSLSRPGVGHFLCLPDSTYVTVDNLRLKGFKITACLFALERYAKAGRLTTLELTGTWRYIPQAAPVTLPTVRTLTLNTRGPIDALFFVIIMPALVHLVVTGQGNNGESQNVPDGYGAFKSVASTLETLHLESIHFGSKDHVKCILIAAPKVKRLIMKHISYEASVDLTLDGMGGWISGLWAMGEYSSEPDYVTLLEDPLILPVLRHCIVDDVSREDLILLRRVREIE
jgi:hypothetical protein